MINDEKAKNIENVEKNILHKSFEVGMLIKGINGALELIGGIMLLFISPARLNRFIGFLTHGELQEEPKSFIANLFIKMCAAFSISTQYFLASYLSFHGLIKLVLVILLLQKNLWAYPLTIVTLVLFIFYQVHRYFYKPSAWLIVLTVFDIIMIVLTIIEYRRVKLKNIK